MSCEGVKVSRLARPYQVSREQTLYILPAHALRLVPAVFQLFPATQIVIINKMFPSHLTCHRSSSQTRIAGDRQAEDPL